MLLKKAGLGGRHARGAGFLNHWQLDNVSGWRGDGCEMEFAGEVAWGTEGFINWQDFQFCVCPF